MKSLLRLFAALSLAAPLCAAAVPSTVSFTARIQDSGRPVTGSHAFVFRIWSGPDNTSTLIWEETKTLAVADGVVSSALGDTTAFTPDVFDGSNRWLEVTLDGAAFPFVAIQSVPYAMNVPWGGVSDRPSPVRRNQHACGLTFTASLGTVGFLCAPLRVSLSSPRNVFVTSWQQFRASVAGGFVALTMCYRAAGSVATPTIIDGFSGPWLYDLPDTGWRQMQLSAYQTLAAGDWDVGACGHGVNSVVQNGNTTAIPF